MDLKDVVAANLRRLRTDAGLSQEELADRSMISARYLGAIERGAVSPSVTIVGRIATGLGVCAEDLVRK